MGILFKIPFYFSYAEAYKETMDPFEFQNQLYKKKKKKKKHNSYLQFEKVNFLRFQIAIFKNAILKHFMSCDLV